MKFDFREKIMRMKRKLILENRGQRHVANGTE
jgi:hypothetical protein